MKKNTEPLSQEFEVFTRGGEEERRFLKWFIIGDIFFLAATLILMFFAENIFHMNILSWKHYWILFFANVIFFSYFVVTLNKNFKVWILKYLLAIYAPLLVGGWIYFSNPEYIKILLGAPVMMLAMIGFIFYNSKVLLMGFFTIFIMFGFLFFHLSRIGSPLQSYDIYLIYVFLIMAVILYRAIIEKTKVFFKELVRARSELEEAKTVLEIKVKARTGELEELSQSLEKKVKVRTKELQEKINQLEKFHKLTVGRELKMVELKKEIKRLKKNLKNNSNNSN